MKIAAADSSSRPKQLLFDRRYGWILDEWNEPSREALSGGRGMFCVLPLAKMLLDKASKSIDAVANVTLEVLGRPNSLSPKTMQATINEQVQETPTAIQAIVTDQLQETVSSINQIGFVSIAPRRSFSLASTSLSSNLWEETTSDDQL